MKSLKKIFFIGLFLFTRVASAQQDSVLQKFSPAFAEHLFKGKLYNDIYSYLNLFPQNNQSDYSLTKEKFLFEKQIYSAEKIKWQPSCDTCFHMFQLSIYQKLNQLHAAYKMASEDINIFYADKSKEKLWTSISFNNTQQNAMNDVLLLTKNLMQHDTIAFKKNEKIFSEQHPKKFKNAIENLDAAFENMQLIPPKKPWKAGLMSTIIPGSGKMYNAQTWQGVSVLLTLSVIGLQAFDGFHKNGIYSVRGWAYTGLFSIFYVGNIWGSVVGVKVKQRKAYENIHRNLLDNADKLVEQF